MGVGILVASHIFGQRSVGGKIKDSPYECGLATEVKGETRYSVKFYVTAMLFFVDDVSGAATGVLSTSAGCGGGMSAATSGAVLLLLLS